MVLSRGTSVWGVGATDDEIVLNGSACKDLEEKDAFILLLGAPMSPFKFYGVGLGLFGGKGSMFGVQGLGTSVLSPLICF